MTFDDYVVQELDAVDVEADFDAMLDECYDFERVGGPFAYMSPARVLQEVDPTAYRCGLADATSEYYEAGGDYYRQDDVDALREKWGGAVMYDTTTMQYWPSGDSVTYAGDPFGAEVRVFPPEWAGTSTPSRVMTDEERRELRVQVRAVRLWEQEGLGCDSALVDALMRLGYESSADVAQAFSLEEVENLYPDPDTMTAQEMRDYVEERGGEVLPAPLTGTCADCGGSGECDPSGDGIRVGDCPTCDGVGDHGEGDEDDDYMDALREAVRDCAEPAEVYEWWRVSGYLCRRLREIGEVVLDNDYGCWWGRTCTGQSVLTDGVLQRVTRGMEA